MTAAVVVLAVCVALLALLVVGLLRSHAEILRRLDLLAGGADAPDVVGQRRAPRRAAGAPAPDVVGTTLAGDPIKVAVAAGGGTLLAFLTSGCSTCRDLWATLPTGAAAFPGDVRVVCVAKDARLESPARLRELAPADALVVCSSAAWDAYQVPGSPYFVHVDGRTGAVVGEGSASSWDGVRSLLADAIADAALPGDTRARVDAELAAAGIVPGHPSLYGRAEQ